MTDKHTEEEQSIDWKNWETFCQEVQGHEQRHISVWRGERNPYWKPEATFQRNVIKYFPQLDEDSKHEKIFELRDQLFHKFKLAMRGMRGPNPARLSYNQVWALGRHFRLNTPLLDWSSSPFLAAAFAVIDNIEKWFATPGEKQDNRIDATQIFSRKSESQLGINHLDTISFAVYQLILNRNFFQIIEQKDLEHFRNKIDSNHHYFLNDRDENKEQLVRVFQPSQSSKEQENNSKKEKKELLLFLDISVEELKRMQGQRGYFTMLHSANYSNIEDFIKENGGESLIKKYFIKDHLDVLVQYLVSHANDLQVLYPDLEGAAKQANLMLLVHNYHKIRE